jgi:3-methyladenine DNA glycosylase Tag
MPANVAAVKAMGWDDMQTLFAAIYADEIAAVLRDGGIALVREKLTALTADARRALRIALDAA